MYNGYPLTLDADFNAVAGAFGFPDKKEPGFHVNICYVPHFADGQVIRDLFQVHLTCSPSMQTAQYKPGI